MICRWVGLLVAWLLLLTGPGGNRIWIVENNVTAIGVSSAGGVGTQTAVYTMGGIFYVREPAADVAKRLEDALKAK